MTDRRALSGLAATCLAAVALAGCDKGIPNTLTSQSLVQANKGAVFLHVSAPPDSCQFSSLWLGRKNLDGRYEMALVHSFTVLPLAEWQLDPDEYHIVQWACNTSFDKAGALGKAQPQWFGPTLWDHSYGSFTVRAGEIVNVGQVNIRWVEANKGRNLGRDGSGAGLSRAACEDQARRLPAEGHAPRDPQPHT